MLFLLVLAVPSAGAYERPDMASPVTFTDQNPALSHAVKLELGKSEHVLDTPDIQIVSDGGTVTIMGWVETKLQRAEAERIARDVNGVSRVINDLKVREPQYDEVDGK